MTITTFLLLGLHTTHIFSYFGSKKNVASQKSSFKCHLLKIRNKITITKFWSDKNKNKKKRNNSINLKIYKFYCNYFMVLKLKKLE